MEKLNELHVVDLKQLLKNYNISDENIKGTGKNGYILKKDRINTLLSLNYLNKPYSRTRHVKKKIEVTFRSLYKNTGDWNSESNINPYINIKNPTKDIRRQENPNEIVIPMKNIKIKYDYPLSNPVIMEFTANKPSGFTRGEIAKKISLGYHKIYNEEHKVIGDPGHIRGMYNRKRSYGPYGIWGHDIGDLDLSKVKQIKGTMFELDIES